MCLCDAGKKMIMHDSDFFKKDSLSHGDEDMI